MRDKKKTKWGKETERGAKVAYKGKQKIE